MQTGSFRTYKGPNGISIARSTPTWHRSRGVVYLPLAPGEWARGAGRTEFERLYLRQLAGLDPDTVAGELLRMVPGEPVLLCWERPPLDVGNWCHREQVADWLHLELGERVCEWEKP